ncbi:hypothetical protein [Methanolobus sp. WCC5]|jgi:ferredoxin|uniref:hypothetical protein n=1 Tax=Methanolobus sp. WCC5 TaxID=3125785 RepID=UPI0032454FA5
MKLVEKKCAMCGSPIYVYENCAREEMFCTLHCMEKATFTAVPRALDRAGSIC